MKRQQIWFVSVIWFSSFLFLSVHIPSVYAEENLQFSDIIDMLDHSGKTFNYLGTKFVIDYTQAGQSTFVKVTYAPGIEKKEVSPSQNGESQIILDDGKHLWHYIPSKASVVKKKRNVSLGDISKRLHRQNQLIQQNYDILITPQKGGTLLPSQIPSVLGDVIVSLQPKTQDRPAWKLWIEREHGLVVRTEIYDIHGKLALLSAFADLTFRPQIPKSTFKITVPKGTKMQTTVEKNFKSIAEAQQEAHFPISAPDYLPSGFILASVILSQARQHEQVQLAYIDGMSSISIFQEKQVDSPDSPQDSTTDTIDIANEMKGTFYDQGLLKILRWHIEPQVQVTLVGEVADSELLKIASSLIK